MKSSVQRWGNSLALRIPRVYAAEIGLREASAVDLEIRDGTLVIRPVRKKRHTLAGLLNGIKAANQHKAIETGPAIGREVL